MLKKNYEKFLILSITSIMGILVLSGCTSVKQQIQDKATEKMIEGLSNGQIKVDVDQGKTKVDTKFGSGEVGENVGVPADFPSDVYVIEGVIKTSYKNAGSNDWTLSIETTKTTAEAKALYEENLKANGWKIDSTLDMGESVVISATKNNRNASVMINADPTTKKTNVIVGSSENK